MVDYHLHTKLCGHACGEMEEYLAAVARQGLTEVGFADHLPLYFLPPSERDPGLAMAAEDLPVYVEAVRKLEGDSPVRVKLGIEADYVPGWENRLAALLASFPFDYILGSVHFIDGWGFDNPAEMEGYRRYDNKTLYRRYFTLVQQAALSGLFDIIAHPDLIKKFGFPPPDGLIPLYEETAAAFKKAGICMEINTAGLRAPAAEIYPSREFLHICCRHGVLVTLGSDAHRPADAGAGLPEAVALIKEAGYREVAVFKKRKRELLDFL